MYYIMNITYDKYKRNFLFFIILFLQNKSKKH